MAVQTASSSAGDAIMSTFLERNGTNIVELESPVLKKFDAAAREIRVNQKGRQRPVTSEVRATIKAGPSNMDYPEGIEYVRTRFTTIPVDQVMTYEIDRATYEDYKRADRDTMTNMAEETQLLMRAFAQRREFFLGGDGTGKLATLAAGSTTTVLVLDTVPNGTHGKAFGASQLRPNVPYDLYSSADAPIATGIRITDGGVDYTNNQVTLTAALGAGPAAGGYLVPTGSWRQMPHGFAYLFQGGKTGWWEGALTTNKPEFNTPYVNAGGQEISNYFIERMLQKHAFRNGSGMNSTFKIFAAPTQISIYKSAGWNMFRFAAKDNEFNTAFKSARYEDSVFEPFPQSDPDAAYGIEMSDCVRVVQTDCGPFRGADNMLFRQKPGSSQTGKGEFYMQYGCSDNRTIDSPQKHIVARNFDVANSVTIFNFNSTT